MKMKPTRHRSGWVLGAVLVGVPALAGTLNGTVVGSSGAPKRFVMVEVFGPQTQSVFTGEGGTFSVEVPGGSYRVRVLERNRRMEFTDVHVPDEGVVAETFKVGW